MNIYETTIKICFLNYYLEGLLAIRETERSPLLLRMADTRHVIIGRLSTILRFQGGWARLTKDI